MKLGVAEILQMVSKEKSKTRRVQLLRQHQSFPLKIILQYAFDPNIEWALPEGPVPYKPNDLNDLEHVLYAEARKLYLFIEGGNPDLKQLRREALFIELLENVDKEDAKLLAAIKDKTIPYPYITYKLVKEAFPELLPEELPPDDNHRGKMFNVPKLI